MEAIRKLIKDYRANVEIDPETVAIAMNAEIELKKIEKQLKKIGGTAHNKLKAEICPGCKGKGIIRGELSSIGYKCHVCLGSGKLSAV